MPITVPCNVTHRHFISQPGIQSHSSRCDFLRHVMMTLSSYVQNHDGKENISLAYSEGIASTLQLCSFQRIDFSICCMVQQFNWATVAARAILDKFSRRDFARWINNETNVGWFLVKSQIVIITISNWVESINLRKVKPFPIRVKCNFHLYIFKDRGREKEITILAKLNLRGTFWIRGDCSHSKDLVWAVFDGHGKKLAVMQNHR